MKYDMILIQFDVYVGKYVKTSLSIKYNFLECAIRVETVKEQEPLFRYPCSYCFESSPASSHIH